MREFKNAKELLALCSEKDLPISEIMRQREIIIGEMQEQEVNARMTHVLEIMKEAAFSPIKHPVKSMGGLIGGESKKLFLHQASGILPSFLPSLSKAARIAKPCAFTARGSPLEWIPFRGQKPRDFLKAFVRRFSGKPWPQRFAAAFLCIGEVRWWERALSAEI